MHGMTSNTTTAGSNVVEGSSNNIKKKTKNASNDVSKTSAKSHPNKPTSIPHATPMTSELPDVDLVLRQMADPAYQVPASMQAFATTTAPDNITRPSTKIARAQLRRVPEDDEVECWEVDSDVICNPHSGAEAHVVEPLPTQYASVYVIRQCIYNTRLEMIDHSSFIFDMRCAIDSSIITEKYSLAPAEATMLFKMHEAIDFLARNTPVNTDDIPLVLQLAFDPQFQEDALQGMDLAQMCIKYRRCPADVSVILLLLTKSGRLPSLTIMPKRKRQPSDTDSDATRARSPLTVEKFLQDMQNESQLDLDAMFQDPRTVDDEHHHVPTEHIEWPSFTTGLS
jgi:hypothetical protein